MRLASLRLYLGLVWGSGLALLRFDLRLTCLDVGLDLKLDMGLFCLNMGLAHVSLDLGMINRDLFSPLLLSIISFTYILVLHSCSFPRG